MRNSLRGLGLIVATLTPGLVACATPGPPLPPGLIDMRSATPGQTTVAAQGGIGGYLQSPATTPYGGGLVSVEPRAGEKLSIPMGAGAGGNAEGGSVVVSTRVGARYRLMESIAVGGGFDSSHLLDEGFFGTLNGVGFDFELGGGGSFGPDRRFSASGSFRPTMLFDPSSSDTLALTFFGVFDASLGYAVLPRLQLTAHLWGGTATQRLDADSSTTGYMAGTIGLAYSFGEFR